MKGNTVDEIVINTARSLRRNKTLAEEKFWQLIRNRKINGLRFYRQYPIEFELDGIKRFFIADFCCRTRKLLVEIDGGVHEQQREYDCYRTFIIEQLGMQVVRFTNEEIRYNIEEVILPLKDHLTP